MNSNPQTLAWNTGRRYTQFGQRIAARQLPNGIIAMVDCDRGIEYLLHPETPFDKSSILRAYDAGHRAPYDANRDYDAVRQLNDELREIARAVPGV